MSSLVEYLGVLEVSIGSILRTHVILGGGLPVAPHVRTVLWPISTTLLVAGGCVICGNPGGNLSTGTNKRKFNTREKSKKNV